MGYTEAARGSEVDLGVAGVVVVVAVAARLAWQGVAIALLPLLLRAVNAPLPVPSHARDVPVPVGAGAFAAAVLETACSLVAGLSVPAIASAALELVVGPPGLRAAVLPVMTWHLD